MTSSSLWETWLLSLCASHYYRFLTSVGCRNTAFSTWLISLSIVSFYSCLAFCCVIQHSLSVCLATDRHLSCFSLSVIGSQTALNTGTWISFSKPAFSLAVRANSVSRFWGIPPVLSSLSFRRYVSTNFRPLPESFHTSPTLIISDVG